MKPSDKDSNSYRKIIYANETTIDFFSIVDSFYTLRWNYKNIKFPFLSKNIKILLLFCVYH